MYVGYKFRLYPNKQQQIQINKTLGCCRFVYNYYLAKNIEQYKNGGKYQSHYDNSKDLTLFKKQKEVEWLNEVGRDSLNKSLENLHFAFLNFFRENKKGNHQYGFPQFKSKHDHNQSYNISNGHAGKKPY